MEYTETLKKFQLNGSVCVITGGAGLLGQKHAEAILDAGGIPILLDISQEAIEKAVEQLLQYSDSKVQGFQVDITNKESVQKAHDAIIAEYGKVDVLINNAANNPKVEDTQSEKNWSRFENFPERIWEDDMQVGLKGSFLCSQIFGASMAAQGRGVILNISSDLGIIAPDQRIYRKEGTAEEEQVVKPVTYSVVKHGLIGLTKYLATYWADKGIRVNAICPAGVYNGQDEDFVKRLSNLVPMGRMAEKDEYKGAILFLISDASSYMTGSVLVVDGGRTAW